MPQQAREAYKQAIIDLLEGTHDVVVQKSRKDGHDEALIDVRGSWMGTDFSPGHVKSELKDTWPGDLFEKGEQMHWIENEDEATVLEFAWVGEAGFLTGRVKITP